MPNQLINEISPYLLQHAENPVNWLPWNDDALAYAKTQNKPIFLSIGYAACHWCHVMAHESFENPQTAALINTYFIPIKVDREERPDLDSIYMSAVVAMTGHGGWPMSVFLTPDGEPFYGGTYFPPVPRHGLPSFREVLTSIAEAWAGSKTEIRDSAKTLSRHIQQNQSWSATAEASADNTKLQKTAAQIITSVDPNNGGWGSAPKFPAPMVLDFLLLQHVYRSDPGDVKALNAAVLTLKQMQKGGIYDVVGGGFHRYATDHSWLIPHFEKMLYDNAQLAITYLHAFLITGDITFRKTCEETLDFLVRELRHPVGGFFSSLDADSDGEEGKFYIWSQEEVHAALAEYPALENLIRTIYPVTQTGNFEGQNILRRTMQLDQIAEKLHMPQKDLLEELDSAHALLREFRAGKTRPETDDKILTAWNALALRAFSEAARYLHRKDYLEVAEQNAEFLLTALHTPGQLKRSWRNGTTNQGAFLEDYAALIIGLISLYQSSPRQKWYQAALDLTQEMIDGYQAPDGSFFTTRNDQQDVIFRPKEIQDNVTPSGNAMAAQALKTLAIYANRPEWQQISDTLLASVHAISMQYPSNFAYWLQLLASSTQPGDQTAVLLPEGATSPAWIEEVLWAKYRPDMLYAQAAYPPAPSSPFMLQFRPLEHNAPTIYLCHSTTCLPAITTRSAFQKHLRKYD